MITLREVEGVKERIRKEIINEIVKKEIKNVDGYIKNKINEEMAKLKEMMLNRLSSKYLQSVRLSSVITLKSVLILQSTGVQSKTQLLVTIQK